MKVLTLSRVIVGLAALSLAFPGAGAPFRAGDRACFFGDSVTHQGYYTSQIQSFYYTRYPDSDIRILNCGVGGETAGEAMRRFEMDIASRKPTFIAFVFGANDVYAPGYATNATAAAIAHRKQAPDEFAKNVRAMAEVFVRHTPKAEIMWCTPPAWDDELKLDPPRAPCRGVTSGERKLADFIVEFAKSRGAKSLDFFNPMVSYNAKLHSKNPRHSLSPDRIHPREMGGLFMAATFLRRQGVSGTVSDTVIDASAAKVLRAANGKVEALESTPAGNLEFTLTERALPFPVEPDARGVADDISFDRELNRELLRFNRLAEGDWELRIDGQCVCVRSHKEWEQGLNLATFTNTPMMAQAREVAALNQSKRAKEDRLRSLYVARAVAFRRLKWQMPLTMADYADGRLAEAFIAGFMNAKAPANEDAKWYSAFARDWKRREQFEKELEQLHEQIRKAAQPKAHRFELVKAGPWAKPELVAAVEKGERKEALVSWWGFDREDSTRFLRAAINSKAAKVMLDRQAGAWMTRQLRARSNLELVIPEGVELVAKRGCFRAQGDTLLTIAGCTNVTVTGGGTVRMWFEDYVDRKRYCWSEWRHAISILDSRNVILENLRVADSGGDGLYVGTHRRGGNHDITVRNVVFSRNNRQGISVITVDGMLVERCILENTCGTLPMAGIDFEPNSANEMLQNIVMRDTIARGNVGSGFDFSVFHLNSDSPPISITLENCRSEGNKRATHIYRSNSAISGFRGKVVFRNCVFNDADPSLKMFSGAEGPSVFSVALENCRAADPARGGELVPMGPEYGWGYIKPPTWPDGSAIRLPALKMEHLARAVIHDAKPQVAVKLPKAHFRGQNDFLVYAAKAGEVNLVCACRRIGRTPFDKCSIEVVDASGKWVAKLAGPVEFEHDTPVAFKAPAPGFYRLIVTVGRSHAIRFVSTDAPIAAVKSLRGNFPSINGGESELYFRLSRACRRFGIMAAGGGGEERIHVKVADPTGREIWNQDNIAYEDQWFSGDRPAPGIWKLAGLKPSKGCIDDYTFTLIEQPLVLFLSPEKTWELPLAD